MSTDKVDKIALGIEFEKWCKAFLVKLGFKVCVTRVTGDGGIDLLAFIDKPIFAGKYVVQCKRFQEQVSESIIRDLYGVVTAERANKGILITAGTFSENAKQFAEDKPIELIDGDQFTTILNEHEVDIGLSINDLGHFQNINSENFNYSLLNQKLEYSKNNKKLRSHVIEKLYNLFIKYAEASFNNIKYKAILDVVIRELIRHLDIYFSYKPKGDKKLYHSQFAYYILLSDIYLYNGNLKLALTCLEKYLSDPCIKREIDELKDCDLSSEIFINANIYLVLKRILLIHNIVGSDNTIKSIKEKYKNVFINWELSSSLKDSPLYYFDYNDYRKYPFPSFIVNKTYYSKCIIDLHDSDASEDPRYSLHSLYADQSTSRELHKENGSIVIEKFTRISQDKMVLY